MYIVVCFVRVWNVVSFYEGGTLMEINWYGRYMESTVRRLKKKGGWDLWCGPTYVT